MPLFLFSLLFGLSMDYQVFLLSRIKERYDAPATRARRSPTDSARTGSIITGAAAIMVCVFGGMAHGQLVMFQQMGFGLAVAVLLDATVVRTIVVPAPWSCSVSATGTCRAGLPGCPTSASRGTATRRACPQRPPNPSFMPSQAWPFGARN